MAAWTEAELSTTRLTARGVILSLLVSNHPAQQTPAHVVRAAGAFDIKESAARVALSRMVTNGDLIRTEDGYELSTPLLERRQRVLFEVNQDVQPWDGTWETVVVTESGREASDRASLRSSLSRLHLAELREGVWMRPANLTRPLSLDAAPVLVVRGTPALDSQQLAGRLWNLDAWEHESARLLKLMDRAGSTVERFTVAAAIVRHLLTDPVLPQELTPPQWSAPLVHRVWVRYQQEFNSIPELHADDGAA